jgi:hypothetical protein
MPEAVPSAPDDVALELPPEPAAGADAPEPELPASPTTLTAFPATCTGTLTSATVWSPVSTPLTESGETEADGAAGAAGVTLEPLLEASPRTETAVPESDTGAETPTTAWSPLATLSPPGTSAAFAAAVPASQRPPTQRVNHIPLETYLFMSEPFE